jgi:hypothetical protein
MYSEIDRNKDGNIASEYPAWSHMRQVDILEQEIRELGGSIKSGRFSSEEVHEMRAKKANLESRHDTIMGSKPKPNDSERNTLWKLYKSFGSKIQNTLYTRSDMKYGLASAHEEARRMKRPCITLDPEEFGIALTCNVTPDTNRMVSRDQATKVFKLLGKILGEPSNVEVLRRDTKKEAFIPHEIAPPKPVQSAPVLDLDTSTEETGASIPQTKSGKPDKRYKKKV